MKPSCRLLTLLLPFLCSLTGAAKHSATISTQPVPLVISQGAEITINTSDLGSEVYLFIWISEGPSDVSVMSWDDAIDPKYRMAGSNGSYSFSIPNLRTFLGLTEAQGATLTRLGFIARSSNDQTDDLLVDVAQQPLVLYSGGTGTSSDPYRLSTRDDLTALEGNTAHWNEGTHFILTADIAAGTCKGIGSKTSPFNADFDGKGHSLLNLAVNPTATVGSPAGFFNVLGNSARVHDLGIVKGEVKAKGATGLLAGEILEGAAVNRCFTTGSATSLYTCAGGLAGINAGTVNDCYSQAAVISAEGYCAGGLVGKNEGSVRNCYASGAVKAFNYAGGFAGANYGSVSASAAINTEVRGNSASQKFIGRFGGNDNGRNSASDTFAWPAMPSVSGWGAFAHQADDHQSNLSAQQAYIDMNWNFTDIWEWTADQTGRQFAMLRGLRNQKAPENEEFFLSNGIGNAIGNAVIISTELFSIQGMRLISSATGESGIDIASLPAGIHILVIHTSDNRTITRKIIKK